MTETPLAVFDCVVFVQALLSKSGPAARCIEMVDLKRVRLVMSEPVLSEIRNTLENLSSSLKNPLITESKIESLINFLLETAEFVDDVPRHFEYSRDRKDEPYINLAIETEAGFIVSRDSDLLDLTQTYSDEAKAFRQRFRKIRIVDPTEFLNIIKGFDLAIGP